MDVDEEQLAKAKSRDSLRVMAAGVAGNVVVALVCLLAVLLIVNGLTPVVSGLFISEVTEGMPAEAAGLLPEDFIVTIDNVSFGSLEDMQMFFIEFLLSDCKLMSAAQTAKHRPCGLDLIQAESLELPSPL